MLLRDDYVDVKQSGNTLIVNQKNNASINLVGTKLRVEVYAPNVKKFLLTGSSDVAIYSNIVRDEIVCGIKGSGDIKAVNLRAVKTTAVALGSSEVKCCATKELVAVASGAGEVTYYGNPAKVSTKGSVNHRGN